MIGQTFSIIDNQVVNYLVNTHQPIQIEDAAGHPYFVDYLAAYPNIKFRTWLGVPLIVRDRFIGQITLDRWTVKSVHARRDRSGDGICQPCGDCARKC